VEPKADLDDLLLIHRVLAGEGEAFRGIVEKYGARVQRFCRARLGIEEEAEDAAQEVFLRAYRSLPSFRLGESFPAWLFSIAANRVRSRGRRSMREALRFDRAAAEAAAADTLPAFDPGLAAERSLEAEALRRAVASLPADQRAVVELYYFAGLSVVDVAAALRLGEEAVKSRLFRARKALRKIIEGEQPQKEPEGI
jgi:RNA polymerase sigma-70 factor (ECF subfamily)